MSLIEQSRNERRGRMPVMERNLKDDGDDGAALAKILDIAQLKEFLDKVISYHTTKADPEKIKDNRKFIRIWDVDLQNVLGYVDDPTWVGQIEAFLDWSIKTMQSNQPNGTWEIYKYEYKLERVIHRKSQSVGTKKDGRNETVEVKTPRNVLLVAVQFVDIKGEEDLAYEGGRPANKSNALDKNMLKALLENKSDTNPIASVVKDQDDQIKAQAVQINSQAEVIEQLRRDQAAARAEQKKTNDLMAGLLTQLKDINPQEGEKKPVRRKK